MTGPDPATLPDIPGLPPSRWVTLDGLETAAPGVDRRTHYVDFGGPADGPVIVCVHGLGGSVIDWMRLAPLLTPFAHVLALDLAGHGRTPALGRPADVHAHRAHVEAFVRQVGGGPAVLVGNSMGGLVSLLAAEATPEIVRGQVLVDPALPVARRERPDPLVALGFGSFLLPVGAKQLLSARRRRVDPDRQVRQMFALCTAHPDRLPADVLATYRTQSRERTRRVGVDAAYLESVRSLLRLVLARPELLRSTIDAVRVPTLLVHGAHDRLVPLHAAETAHRQRPDWRFEVHPDAGHLPQLEEPEWVAALIADWFATTTVPWAAVPAASYAEDAPGDVRT